MKNLETLVIAAIFAISFFAITPAKAQTTYYFNSITDVYTYLFGTTTPTQAQLNSAYMSYFGTTNPTQDQINSVVNQYVAPGNTTALPIANQVWVLFIAAGIIGCSVIMKNKKSLQPVLIRG